jgi:2-octaprenyl-6-methoxyphenol hydroxylase
MKHDVIILGSGPNGLATALALGGSTLLRPLRVLVLDARNPGNAPVDTRGTALTQATLAMFKALGVAQKLTGHLAEMRDVIVTDGAGVQQDRPRLLNFFTGDGAKAAASLVENSILNNALLAAVENSPSIELKGGFSFSKLDTSPARVVVSAVSGEDHAASLLIAADGRNSPVRQALGLTVTKHDYGQTALGFSIVHTLPHDFIAEEHFSADGVFAVLPLAGQSCSIVWGTSPAEADRLMALDEAAFNEVLQGRMGLRLGEVKVSGRRLAYPLVMQIAHQFVAPRVALLGDAAHAIHPLAGLGLNLGFKDAAYLADCVAEEFARGGDIGSLAVLDRYQTSRRFETVATSLAMDAMNGLFANNNPVLKMVRRVGLQVVDKLPFAKATIMASAAGQSQDNPRLMQGLLPG